MLDSTPYGNGPHDQAEISEGSGGSAIEVDDGMISRNKRRGSGKIVSGIGMPAISPMQATAVNKA